MQLYFVDIYSFCLEDPCNPSNPIPVNNSNPCPKWCKKVKGNCHSKQRRFSSPLFDGTKRIFLFYRATTLMSLSFFTASSCGDRNQYCLRSQPVLNGLSFLSFFFFFFRLPHYSGSPQRDSMLHFTRSTSSPSLAPTLSMSSLTKSIHLLLGLPLFLPHGTAIPSSFSHVVFLSPFYVSIPT